MTTYTLMRARDALTRARIELRGTTPTQDIDEALAAIEAELDATPRRVRKTGGSFQHTGTVVAEFQTLAGEPRIVIEFDAPVAGMLHIYRPDQVAEAAAGDATARDADALDAERYRWLRSRKTWASSESPTDGTTLILHFDSYATLPEGDDAAEWFDGIVDAARAQQGGQG